MKQHAAALLLVLAAGAGLSAQYEWTTPRQIIAPVALENRNVRVQATTVPGSLKVAWDRNPAGDSTLGYLVSFNLVGVRIRPNIIDVGNAIEYTASNLEVGKSYEFRVYAYSDMLLSDSSEVITAVVPQPPPPPPPPPPPSCSGTNAPGASPEVSVVVQSYDLVAARSDPKGMLVRFDAGSSEAIVRIELDLEGDGEPAVPLEFPVGVGFDGRYIRALSFKPTINGSWPLVVSAQDAVGRRNAVRCTPNVTVTF